MSDNVTVPSFGVIKNSSGATIVDEIENHTHDSLKLIDEDTGEKYIVKVKSSALKLYKVEETNDANGPANNGNEQE